MVLSDPRLRAVESPCFACSDAQRALWQAATADPRAALAQVDAVSLQLDGPLDPARLEAALRQLGPRHTLLCARFDPDGTPWLAADAGLLMQHEPAASPAMLDETCAALLAQPFDLQHGPLLRAHLIPLGGQRHELLLAGHRLLGGRAGLALLLRELGELYRQRQLPLALVDASGTLASTSSRGNDLPADPELPADRSRCSADDGRAAVFERPLPKALPAAVDRLARAQQVDPASVLATAVVAWLARLCGESRLRIALPTRPRSPHLAPEGLLQLGALPLPLALAPDPARSFADLLQDVAGRLAAGLGDGGRAPSFAFSIEPAFDGLGFDWPGLRCRARAHPRAFDQHELALALMVSGERWRLECHYRPARFERATIEHWLDALETLLLGAVEQPAQALGRIPLLSDAARAALDAWQPLPQPKAEPGWIHRRIDAICASDPHRVAVRAADGELEYGELQALSFRLARRLAVLGVGPGTRVGLCLERGRDLLPAMLAVLRCGAAYVPLDPAFPPERLEFMVLDAGLSLVVSSGPLAERRPLPAPLLLLDRERAVIEAESAAPFDPLGSADDPATTAAYVIYTSGSTGMPKGVVVAHAAVANLLQALDEAVGFAPGTRLLAVTTLSFDIAVLELLWPLANAGTVVLATREQALDGRELRRLVEAHGIGLLQAAPVGWRLLLEAGFEPAPGFRALCGGEPLPRSLVERLGGRCELWNLYGPTETTVWSCAWRVEPRAAGPAIGRPLRNTTVRVLDAHGQPCPVGVIGELYIGGDGLALGYLERPELTAQRFVLIDTAQAGPPAVVQRLYRTGDRGRWASDGLLEHHGRLDDQVKLRGHRIELGEIEAQLAGVAGIAEAAVLLREDRAGDPRLVAYLAPTPGSRLDPARIRVELRRFLPDYMLPAHFIELPLLPRLPNRKIDRSALPSPLAGERNASADARPRAPRDPSQIRNDPSRTHGRLSADQARVWLLQALHADSVAFNRPSAHRLLGPLDAAALEQALRALLTRQSSLRTVIERGGDGQPLQRELPPEALQAGPCALPPLFPPEDLAGLPAAEREAELRERLQRETDRPFELEGRLLLRLRLFRLAADEHVLLVVAHDLVCDERGFDLLVEDLATLYAAARRGEAAALPPLPVSYLDYAEWHDGWLRGPEYARQRAFWHERLGRLTQAPLLPTDRPRQLARGGRAGHEWVRIPRWLADALEGIARDAGTGLPVVLLAAYATLLARFAGQSDLVIGLPHCGRQQPPVAGLVGQFTKLLPLPVTVNAEQSFLALLRATDRNREAMQACSEVQLEDVVSALPAAVAATGSAYHALFSIHDIRGWPANWAELQHESMLVRQQGCCEDLGLRLVEHADGISGALQFDASRFERSTAALLRDQYLSLIARIVEKPGERIEALWRPAPFEVDRLAGWGSGRPVPEVAADSLTARFRRACAERPQAPALVEAGRSHPYRVLGTAVAAAALQLRARIWSGEVVAVALPHGFDRTVAILACLSVGGVCLLLDPTRPLRELAACVALVDRGREHGGRNGSSVGAAGPWLIAERPLAHTLRWPAKRRMEPAMLQQAGDIRSELQRSPSSSSLLLPCERSGAPLGLLEVPERMLLALDGGLREAGLFGEEARVAALAPPDAPRSLIESLLPLVAGGAVVVEPQRQGLAAWLESMAVTVLIADAEAWQREFQRGWRGRDGLATVADGALRALADEPDLAQLRGQHWHAFGDPQAGLWTLLGPASGIARVLPARTVRIEDRNGQPTAIGAFGNLRLCADGHVGSPAAEARVGRARWRADGSLELETDDVVAPLQARLHACAAETPLQALLHDLWSDVLGHAGFGVDDNFFELGGHSLIAVRMFQQAERETAVNLPLSTLYRAPTIRSLAAAFAAAQSRVSNQTVATQGLDASASDEDLWRPLVPIRPAGRARPLFLVHAVGGNVMNYRVLVDALPGEQPVYGLQAVGLDGVSAPLRSIASMADRYLEEISALQPHGPYRLGGGSMGGVIAFEIARRLRARGETVELLALIDSELPGRPPPPRPALADRLRQLRAWLAVGPGELGGRLARAIGHRAATLRDLAAVAGYRLRRRPLPHALRYRRIEAINWRACRCYRPGPYDGPVMLFLASDFLAGDSHAAGASRAAQGGHLRGRDLDPTLGWGALIGEGLSVIPVGGTHNDVIGRASLAAALVDALAALPAMPVENPGSSA